MKFYLSFIFVIFVFSNNANSLVDDWTGNWEGTCQIIRGNSPQKVEGLKMSLFIQKVSAEVFNWQITYAGESTRAYQIIKRNVPNQNLWRLDEKNGILIDKFYDQKNNEFKHLYTVNGKIFSSKEKLINNSIIIQTNSFLASNYNTTKLINSNMQVTSYQFNMSQSCTLNPR